MKPLLLLTVPTLLVAGAAAQTVTVTTSQNVIDVNYFTATIADLPGPDGEVSFLEAIVATNHTPGHQVIAFNIPQSDWGLQFLYPGAAVLVAGPNGFNASDSVTIDGTTQTAFTGDTNPAGAEVAIYLPFSTLGAGLGGDNSVLQGFHAGEWSVSGDNCLVTDNTGGMHINVSGDGNLIQNNAAGTIKVYGGSNTSVVGNSMQRVRVWSSSNTMVGGPSLAERNYITGYGTTNSEGLPAGTDVELWSTTDTVIENNFIGTTPDGMSQGALYQTMGIKVDTDNTGLRVRDNLIAGVLGHGTGPHWPGSLWGWAIYFQGNGSDVEFSGNTIGLDASGAATLPSVWGVHTASSQYTDVRFLDNEIAGHYFNGVTIGSSTPAVRLQGNRIYGNAWSSSGFVGIDLLGPSQATGVTPNDPGDSDTGGNGLQNYPLLTQAVLEAGGTRLSGTLDSTPGTTFTLEFFASSACDPSGNGQAELPLGTLTVVTDGAGLATFQEFVSAAPADWVVTATATREPSGATSEFSPCIAVDVGPAYNYCSTSPNSVSSGATITWQGSVSIADNDFNLLAMDGPAIEPGLFYYGTTGISVPFGDGFRCVGGAVFRVLPTETTDATGMVVRQLDFTQPPAGSGNGQVLPGSTWNFQFWFRDPAGPGGSGFNLTDGLSVTFGS